MSAALPIAAPGIQPSSGVLMPVTSLPSDFGIGDLGPAAYDFADALAENDQQVWQVLPVNPTDAGTGNCPYSAMSAFAGETSLISPELLVKDGYLSPKVLKKMPAFAQGTIDYDLVAKSRVRLFDRLLKETKGLKGDPRFEDFCQGNQVWLEDYARFAVFRRHFKNRAWQEWPKGLVRRDSSVIEKWSRKLSKEIARERMLQFVFSDQWARLREHCAGNRVRLFGDVPLYVQGNSADAWASRSLFHMSDEGWVYTVSGTPPDAFSKTGQRWGHPTYRWDQHEKDRFSWWLNRLGRNRELFDHVRLDHFQGLVRFWDVPGSDATAENGKWVDAPADRFLKSAFATFPDLSLIAEDLGNEMQSLAPIMERFGIPGMRVLQYGFGGGADNPHALENLSAKAVVYTGTHDNVPTRAWFGSIDRETRVSFDQHYDSRTTEQNVARRMVEMGLNSPAFMAIAPVQDVLNLGAEAAINHPSTVHGNWRWRMTPNQLDALLEHPWLRQATRDSGRSG